MMSLLGTIIVYNVILWGLGLVVYADFEEFKKLGFIGTTLITLLLIGCYLITGGR